MDIEENSIGQGNRIISVSKNSTPIEQESTNKAGRPTRQTGQRSRQANKAGRPTRQAGQQGRQANQAGRQTRQVVQQ